MPTSSIKKNYIISGKNQVKNFINAVEASACDKTPRVKVNVTYLSGADNIVKFMTKAKNKRKI